jgi:hypothetical protein
VVLACGIAVLGAQPSAAQAAATSQSTGFTKPYAGAARFQPLAPRQVTGPDQLHQPLGQEAADLIAHQIGLSRSDAFSPRQFRLFISGRGHHGRAYPARVLDRSVKIFVNTVGHPLHSDVAGQKTTSVLASYGLFVTHQGLLESLANKHAPTRKANRYIEPGGYLGDWCIHNHATRTLRALYRSAYTVEAAYGYASQQLGGTAELVRNTQDGVTRRVGMSMVPSIWIVNFALIYVLKPSLAAQMPEAWAPVPRKVAHAIARSRTGQVRYARFASLLP